MNSKGDLGVTQEKNLWSSFHHYFTLVFHFFFFHLLKGYD